MPSRILERLVLPDPSNTLTLVMFAFYMQIDGMIEYEAIFLAERVRVM